MQGCRHHNTDIHVTIIGAGSAIGFLTIGPLDLYILLIASFGAGFVVLVTTVAAKFGTVGGVLGGLPITGAWAIASIGATQGIAASTGAVGGYLLGCAVWFCFMLSYSAFCRNGFWRAMVPSLAIWGTMSAILAFSGGLDFFGSVAVGIVISATVLYLFKTLKIETHIRERAEVGRREASVYFVASFVVLSAALFASGLAGPFYGGLIATAPIISGQILYWTYRKQGFAFSRAMAKSITSTAVLTIYPYGATVWLLYPIFGRALGTVYGLLAGTVLAYGVAAVGAYASYRISRRGAETSGRRRSFLVLPSGNEGSD